LKIAHLMHTSSWSSFGFIHYYVAILETFFESAILHFLNY